MSIETVMLSVGIKYFMRDLIIVCEAQKAVI